MLGSICEIRLPEPSIWNQHAIMKQLASLIVAGTVLVACATTSLADMVIYTTATPIPFTLTDWSGSLSFPQFQPSLGILTMVQLDLQGGMQTVLTVDNTGAQSSSGDAKTEVAFTVQDLGGNLIAPEIDFFSPAYNFNLAAGDSTSSGTLTQNSAGSDQYTAAAVLNEFIGTGSIVLSASTYTTTWIGYTGGNTLAAQATSASLTGQVTYYYESDPVPEPVSLAFFGLGGLVFWLRRRQ
jgi:PEP-CTERM motif